MRRGSGQTAFDISQSLLDRTARAQMEDDFDAFFQHVTLPYSLAADGEQTIMHNRQEVQGTFDAVRAHYMSLGTTELKRMVTFALFDGPDIIHSTHETTVLGDGVPVAPSFSTYVRYKRTDQGWRIQHSQFWLSDLPGVTEVLLGSARQKSEQSAIACDAVRAVFQRCLNSFTITLLKGTEEQIWHLVQPPLFIQGNEGNRVLENRKDVTNEIHRYRATFRMNQVTDIVRLVKSAEMIGNRRISGTFRTHILSGTQIAVPSYVSTMTLEQAEDLNWRVTSFVHPMNSVTLDQMVQRTTQA
ncbi:MAG: hypothetical protein N4A61_03795 [Pelagimonas sp.]|jgi:hypothetical protein|nr:hypothetical protein [Pelagimonas sp.]